MRLLILVLSVFAATAHAADDYSGWWHNKKNEFQTLGFGLRKDGRGVFGTAIAPVILRWERTDNGIILKIAGEGQTTEMGLTYDAATKTFVFERPGGERESFWKVSTDEPPDAESQMEERRRQEQKAIPASNERQEEFASFEKLSEAIQSWAGRTPPNARGLTAFVRANDSSWSFTLRNLGGNYFVEMPVLRKTADKTAPGLSYAPARSTTEPDLPMRFALPKPQADAFRKWLTDHGIAFTDSAYEARGPWRIEGYYTTIYINLKTDRDTLLSITHYLLSELFRDTKLPYSFSTYERNGG